MSRSPQFGTGTFHLLDPPRSSLDSRLTRPSGFKVPHTIRSAPTVLQTLHFDGATITSSSYLRAISVRVGTDILYVGSQGVTATEFPPMAIQFHSNNIIYFHDLVRHTTTWLNDADGPRLIRGIAPTEPSSVSPEPMAAPRRPPSPPPSPPSASASPQEGKKLCDCCAAARITRELESLMAEHTQALLTTNDIAFHFTASFSAGSGQPFMRVA